MKTIKIDINTGCGNCPGRGFVGQYPPSAYCGMDEERGLPPFDRGNPNAPTPDWCPLRKGPITITAEEDGDYPRPDSDGGA